MGAEWRLCARRDSPPMKLNILSDLHLGHGGLDYPRNDADVVILAGDIARPREAVAWAQRDPPYHVGFRFSDPLAEKAVAFIHALLGPVRLTRTT